MTNKDNPSSAVCDREGYFLEIDPAFAETAGETARAGKSLFGMVPANWQADVVREFCGTLYGKATGQEFPLKEKNGNTVTAVLCTGKNAVHVRLSGEDRSFSPRGFFETFPEPCFFLDRQLRIRHANAAASSFYGLGNFDLLSRTFSSLGPSGKDAFAQGKRGGSYMVRHHNAEKEVRDLEVVWKETGGGFYVFAHDITALARNNSSLSECAERFRLMVESAPGCFYMISPDWSQVYFAGPMFESIFERSRDDFYANPSLMLTVIHPDDREKAMQAYSVQSGVAEYRIILPGGTARRVRDFIIPVMDEAGEVKAYTGYMEALEEINYTQGDSVYYSVPSDTQRTAAGVFLERSETLAQILGYENVDDLLSVPYEKLYADPKLRDTLVQKLLTNGYLRDEAVEYQAKNGKLVWVSLNVDKKKSPEGEDWFDTVVNDITALKVTENVLEQTDRRTFFSTLANGLVMAEISYTDGKPRFRFTTCNPAFEEIAGVTETQIVGHFYDDIFQKPETSKIHEILLNAAVKKTPVSFNMTVGEGRYFRVAAFFPSENEMAAVLTDISDMRKAERELETSHEKLRTLAVRLQHVREDERRQLSRELHDSIGSLLTSAKLTLSSVEDMLRSPAKDKSRAEIADVVKKMEDHVTQVMSEMRRIAVSLRPPILDDLGFVDAIKWLVSDFQEISGIGCKLRVDPQCCEIAGDYATAVFRIIQESLTNVIRHAKATRVKIGITCQDDMVILAVDDNGRGISKDVLNSSTSLGILGMRERALALGGELKIVSGANGTQICAHIPFTKGTNISGNCSYL